MHRAWKTHIDDDAKYFTVYHGDLFICAGYFNTEAKTIHNIEFLKAEYQKNNRTRLKAMEVVRSIFPGYK